MAEDDSAHDVEQEDFEARHKVTLPGFGGDESVGLGTAIKRITTSIGIKPCGGCRERAAALDRFIAFTGRKNAGR